LRLVLVGGPHVEIGGLSVIVFSALAAEHLDDGAEEFAERAAGCALTR
jgi:hypothetical protein